MAEVEVDDASWWRHAVIYEVYPRSFADSDGDGIGDLAGVRAALPYLVSLGVDALWFTPWYASPLIDGGYDVADYRVIHPELGTLREAELLIAEASEHGIRTIVDVVPNHVSSAHNWFQEALVAGPGSAARERFWFRDGGGRGEIPPNQWPSNFHGPTWSRVVEADGRPGQWYLHLFTPEQPDLNWTNPGVWEEHESVLRFWFDRGVAGIRVDSAALLIKDPGLADIVDEYPPGQHPNTDRDQVHDVYRSWRRVANSYRGTRVLVGEVWLPDATRFANYLRDDEMHTAFNFDFMIRPWDAGQFRESIDDTLSAHALVGAPSTWVLSNHDITRPVTRYGREKSGFSFADKRFGEPTDLALGHRRARAAALLTAALPGSLYIYQGDELGLPEVEDMPDGARRDPMYLLSGGKDPGRDGCRVPLPWRAGAPNVGFSPVEVATWLPQPAWWADYAVDGQVADPGSMLNLYRTALALRRSVPGLACEQFSWIDSDPGVLAFTRGTGADTVTCLVNMSGSPVALPESAPILLASGALRHGHLEPDNAVWLAHNPKEK
ncbi:glycoside hydrolase family 13 protein [Tessaracoccus defluvii]|uniref:Glycoside hydrolase family 13 protein n=1 Tax=Tessaracoccus defluvii TaxID=1285901 RepID=A0A7H0H6U0_9ACTN|nr:glycoside hydrolase family 13 protein [Tessaracoccus defluvii]QNP56256.1 glycoside hydrolase family 13 protein [Tessaracoccus defluvii]